MTRRSLYLLLVPAICASLFAVPGSAAARNDGLTLKGVSRRGADDYRPDEWIKLCGLSTGCVVGPPPPHPWHGNDIYNTTGRKQKVAVRMEDGEGARFWILMQNDGVKADTFVLNGCPGNKRFVILAVLVGRHKRPDWRAVNITKEFRKGTAEFTFPAGSKKKRVITVNILAPTPAEGVMWRCPITISSTADPSLKDKVIAQITTY